MLFFIHITWNKYTKQCCLLPLWFLCLLLIELIIERWLNTCSILILLDCLTVTNDQGRDRSSSLSVVSVSTLLTKVNMTQSCDIKKLASSWHFYPDTLNENGAAGKRWKSQEQRWLVSPFCFWFLYLKILNVILYYNLYINKHVHDETHCYFSILYFIGILFYVSLLTICNLVCEYVSIVTSY